MQPGYGHAVPVPNPYSYQPPPAAQVPGIQYANQGPPPSQGPHQNPSRSRPPLPPPRAPLAGPGNPGQFAQQQPSPNAPPPWQVQTNSPSAPSVNHVPAPIYNPSVYGPMPGAQQSPLNPMSPSAAGRPAPGLSPSAAGFTSDAIRPQGGGPGLAQSSPGNAGPSHRWSQAYPAQHNVQVVKPPLPPRPSSVTFQPPMQQLSQPTSYPQPSPSQPPQNWSTPYLQSGNSTGWGSYQNHGPGAPPPANSTPSGYQNLDGPPPPPLPQGYQTQLQQNDQTRPPHPPYSHLPPTNRYNPIAQQGNQQQPGHNANPGNPEGSGQTGYPLGNQGLSHSTPPLPPPKMPASPYVHHPDLSQHQQPGQQPPVMTTSAPAKPPARSSTWVSAPPATQVSASNFTYTPNDGRPGTTPVPRQNIPNAGFYDPGVRQQTPDAGQQVNTAGGAQPLSPLPQGVSFGGSQHSQQQSRHHRVESVPSAGTHVSTGHPILQPEPRRTTPLHGQGADHLLQSHQRGEGSPITSRQQIPEDQASLQDQQAHGMMSQLGDRPLDRPAEFTSLAHQNHQMGESTSALIGTPDNSKYATPPIKMGLNVREPGGEPLHSSIGASALGGIGGPSDWEHFGISAEDENLDDTEITGARDDKARLTEVRAPSPPSQPSVPVREDSTSNIHSAITTPLELPTPPVPEPLHPRHRASKEGGVGRLRETSLSHSNYVPTPPLASEHRRGSLVRTESIVSAEDLTPGEESRRSIDGAIQAWSQPLDGQSSPTRDEPNPSVSSASDPSQENRTVPENAQYFNSFANETVPASVPVMPVQSHRQGGNSQVFSLSQESAARSDDDTTFKDAKEDLTPSLPQGDFKDNTQSPSPPKVADAFSDLDSSHKDSLRRYAEMLRSESRALTTEDKLRVFKDFIAEELQRRGLDPAQVFESKHNLSKGGTSSDSGILNDQASEKSRPVNPVKEQPNSGSINDLGVEDYDDEEYSPGGRPVRRPLIVQRSGLQSAKELASNHSDSASDKATGSVPARQDTNAPVREPDSPGRNAPIPVEVASSPTAQPKSIPISRSNLKLSIDSGKQRLIFQDGQISKDGHQGYQPYSPPAKSPPVEGSRFPFVNTVDGQTEIHGRRSSSYRPFSMQFQPAVDELINPRIEKHEPTSIRPSQQWNDLSVPINKATTAKAEHQETFLANGRRTSGEATGHGEEPMKDSAHPTPYPQGEESLRPTALLAQVLPQNRQPKDGQCRFIVAIERVLKSIPDDFAFIVSHHSAWDIEAKKTRQKYDEERRKRQEEQETHTDRLFAENQIGYADIKSLEEGFKKSESQKKAKEDNDEYHSYARKVFDPLYVKLQEQIKDLMGHYVSCLELMKIAPAGKKSLEAPNGAADLAQMTDVFLKLHDKIEIRHGKVLDAILERDRKYKKTVIQPLYSQGDIAKMKQLEKHFDQAEKKAILEAATKKEERVKRSMAAVQDSTARGLAEDRDYTNVILEALRKISDALNAKHIHPNPAELQDLYRDLNFARTVLQTLANTSEIFVRGDHSAALALAGVRHDVSIASARLAGTNPEAVKELREEKVKDVDRLEQDLKPRVAAVQSEFQTALSQVDASLALLALPGEGPSADPVVDVRHTERIRMALEDARRRNAAQAVGSEGPRRSSLAS